MVPVSARKYPDGPVMALKVSLGVFKALKWSLKALKGSLRALKEYLRALRGSLRSLKMLYKDVMNTACNKKM